MDSKAIYKLMVKKCPNTKKNKHYLKRYVRFVAACLEKNQDLPEDTYTENHHILPKAKNFWPEYKNFILHTWNKAILTKRQHILSHYMLAKAYGGRMYFPLRFMYSEDGFLNYDRGVVETELYWHSEEAKIKRQQTIMDVYGVDNLFKSEIIKERIKETNRLLYGVDSNVSQSPEIQKIIKENYMDKYGVEHHNQLPEHRNRLSNKMSNTQKIMPLVTCIFCKKSMKVGYNFKTWHGANCKENPNRIPIYHKCIHCGFKSENKGMISRFHNENCKHK